MPTAALVALSACAPSDNVLERTDSPLSVETVDVSSDRIESDENYAFPSRSWGGHIYSRCVFGASMAAALQSS